jgi:hypothetical protein
MGAEIDVVVDACNAKPCTACLLTQGQVAYYNLEDSAIIEQHKWLAHWNARTKSFYAQSSVYDPASDKRVLIHMSRLIMGLGPYKIDKRQADHINHNTLDNRRSNLRIVTQQQNQQNKKNTKGCYLDKRYNVWQARICVDRKIIFLGNFDTEIEARQEYLKAREKYGFIQYGY